MKEIGALLDALMGEKPRKQHPIWFRRHTIVMWRHVWAIYLFIRWYELFFGGEESVYSQVGGDDMFWGFKHNWRHYFSFMHNLHSGIVNDYALWAVIALALAMLYAMIIL